MIRLMSQGWLTNFDWVKSRKVHLVGGFNFNPSQNPSPQHGGWEEKAKLFQSDSTFKLHQT